MRHARFVDGQPVEIIEPFVDDEGREVPVSERFTPEVVETLQPWPEGEALP